MSHYGELPMFLSLDIAEFMPLSQTRKERKKSLKIQTRERDDLERPFRRAACFSGTRRFSKGIHNRNLLGPRLLPLGRGRRQASGSSFLPESFLPAAGGRLFIPARGPGFAQGWTAVSAWGAGEAEGVGTK